MKILRVAPDIYPYSVGGLGIHTHQMSKHQAGLGHEVTVFSSLKNSSEKKIEHTSGYKIVRHKELLNIYGNSISLEKFFSLNETFDNYDIIHAHSHLFFSTNITSLIRKFKNETPLVITSHGLIPVSGPEVLYQIFLPTLANWTFNNSDAVLCYTDDQKKKLAEVTKTNQEKIHVVPNGIDTDLFYSNPIPHNNFRIFWVGRMVERKGVWELVQVFKQLINGYDNIELHLAGRGPLENRIRNFVVKNSLEDSVRFHGFIDYEEMPKVYNSCDLFVLPSHHEGVPKSVLEAMACGLPIVMTEMEHLRDLMEGCGSTHPKGDLESIREKIKDFLTNRDMLREMSENCTKKIQRNYNWKNTVEKTTKIFKTLV